MYTEVVVLTYQSPEIDSYTYEIPTGMDVKVGQLVEVPFGNRNPMGVVLSLTTSHPGVAKTTIGSISDSIASLQNDKREYQNDKAKIEIKQLRSIVFQQPLLLPYQVELLKWMNFYYQAPMVKCLEAILPKLPGLSTYHNPGLGNLGKSLLTASQTLVLVPSINQIPQTLALYPHAKNYVVYHGEQKPWERFVAWQKIQAGNIDLVVGTRSAIFTPCPNLKAIVIESEHEDALKDERSPYYNTLTVAEKLKELTNCELEIVDDTPKITTYFGHPNIIKKPNYSSNEVRSRTISSLRLTPDRTIEPKVQIVDMANEKAAGNKTPLSEILQDYIKAGAKKNKKILLFLNKKAQSGHVYCKSCKYSDFAKKKPAACPNCQLQDILFYTNNIKSLTGLVQKIVGGDKLGSIDIATAAVFYQLMQKKYDLVAHVSCDTLLNLANYTSPEKLYVQITNLKKITRGLLLLQTYNPQDPTIKAASDGDYKAFVKSQLAMRKMLKYPPFVLLVKLSAKGKDESKLEQKAQKLFDDLKQLTVNSSPRFAREAGQLSTVSVLGPYKPTFGTTKTRYNIILKVETQTYTLKAREAAVKLVEPLLAKVPREWKVEVEADDIN